MWHGYVLELQCLLGRADWGCAAGVAARVRNSTNFGQLWLTLPRIRPVRANSAAFGSADFDLEFATDSPTFDAYLTCRDVFDSGTMLAGN